MYGACGLCDEVIAKGKHKYQCVSCGKYTHRTCLPPVSSTIFSQTRQNWKCSKCSGKSFSAGPSKWETTESNKTYGPKKTTPNIIDGRQLLSSELDDASTEMFTFQSLQSAIYARKRTGYSGFTFHENLYENASSNSSNSSARPQVLPLTKREFLAENKTATLLKLTHKREQIATTPIQSRLLSSPASSVRQTDASAEPELASKADVDALRLELRNFQEVSLTKLDGLKQDIEDLKKLLTSLMANQTTTSSVSISGDTAADYLPLCTMEDFQNLELKLAAKSSYDELVSIFMEVEGDTLTKTIDNILYHAFSADILQKLRWTDVTENAPPLKTSLTIKAIKEALYKSERLGTTTQILKINYDIVNWFRNHGCLNNE